MRTGAEATVERTVEEELTAAHLGSGDVAVLGTPAVVALCEAAAVASVADELAGGQTTVGTRIELDHLAPSPPGSTITARARLDGVDGRKLTFAVEASDGAGPIARGRHSRVVVDREKFLEGARKRG